MRSVFLRLTALAGAVALVASCDTRLPTAAIVGNTPTSSTSSTVGKPSVVIDSPLVGTLINLGDSVLVSVRLHAAKRFAPRAWPALQQREASTSERSRHRRATRLSGFRRPACSALVFATRQSVATSSRSIPPTRRSIVSSSSSSPPTASASPIPRHASSTSWPVPRRKSCRRSMATAFRPALA